MKLKYTWIPFSIASLIVIFTRALQLTGNLTISFPLGTESFFFLTALSGLVLVILMSVFYKSLQKNFFINKNIILGITGLLAGISSIFFSIDRIKFYLNANHMGVYIFLGLTGLVASFIFIIMSISSIIGKNLLENFKILSLIPTLWAVVRLFSVFIEYNSTINNIFTMSDEISAIFFLLFLFNHAKVFANIEYKDTDKKIFISGMGTTMFSLVYISKLIFEQISSTGSFNIWAFPGALMDLLFAVYAILFIINLKKCSYEKAAQIDNVDTSSETTEKNEEVTTNENIQPDDSSKINAGTDCVDETVNNNLDEVNELIEKIKKEG